MLYRSRHRVLKLKKKRRKKQVSIWPEKGRMGVVTLAYGKLHWENPMQPLEFWSQVMPPAAEIYAPFEK